MMITKETFVKLITMIMNTIDDKREFIEDNDYIPDECKDCIREECDFLKDLITMITVVTFDRFGVIRDYLYERDENDEYFFGIPKGNKLEVYLLTSPEELYEYLAEESEGFCLIAKKGPQTNWGRGSEVVTVEQKKISSPSNEMLEKPRRIVVFQCHLFCTRQTNKPRFIAKKSRLSFCLYEIIKVLYPYRTLKCFGTVRVFILNKAGLLKVRIHMDMIIELL